MSIAEASPYLGIVLGSALTLIVGRFQERFKRGDRQRELAGALLGECERLRKELGNAADYSLEFKLQIGEYELPSIHAWIVPLIPQAAVINPAIVHLFIKLQEQLRNLGGMCDEYTKFSDALKARRSSNERAEEIWENGGIAVQMLGPAIHASEVQDQETLRVNAEYFMEDSLKQRDRALEIVDSIGVLLVTSAPLDGVFLKLISPLRSRTQSLKEV
jgi:hypothetical protein